MFFAYSTPIIAPFNLLSDKLAQIGLYQSGELMDGSGNVSQSTGGGRGEDQVDFPEPPVSSYILQVQYIQSLSYRTLKEGISKIKV